MLYRISGVRLRYNRDTRGWEPTGQRVTVRRARNGDVAYYETVEDAVRGLRGFKGNGHSYVDYQIEETSTMWLPVS